MKSLVVYSSQTGNTRKLAEAVFEALPGEKELYPVEKAPDPSAYGFIAVGFWFMRGQPDPKSGEYIGKIGNRELFLFATHAARVGSEHAGQGMEAAKALASNADIRGTYSCQGQASPKILEKASGKPEPPVWLADAPDAIGHPNQADIEALNYMIAELFRS
ncbi:MAG: flavodoxin family protein [Desulfobacteraceae bacterium]|jgi:flavodoxin|nr:flavodoxin family protein [Desulfobacteraceae bacterium]